MLATQVNRVNMNYLVTLDKVIIDLETDSYVLEK